MAAPTVAPAHPPGVPPGPPSAPPPDADERATTPLVEAGAELALVAVTAAAVIGLGRLFADGSFLAPVLTAVVASHVLAWGTRRLGWTLRASALLSAVGLVLVISWVVEPATTTYGVPGGGTWHTAVNDLHAAWDRFSTVVAPAPVTRGFVLASVLAAWLSAFVADAAAFRLSATFESLIPSFTMFVFGSVLGANHHRLAAAGLYLAAVLLVLVFLGVVHRSETTTWLAGRREAGGLAIVRRGLVVGVLALAAALVLGPHIPGAHSKGLVNWKDKGDKGPGSRVTVSPLVDIRSRLLDPSDTELFTVQASTPAYWRLTSLDRFDGRIWSSVGTYKPASGGLPAGVKSRVGTDSVTASFEIAALSSIWLPAAYRPTRLDGVKGVRFDEESSSLLTDAASAVGLRYRVQSALPRPTPQQLAAATPTAPQSLVSHYTELTADFPSSVRALAARVTAGQATTFGKAKALQDYLRSNYTYDLNVRPGHDNRALEFFLFRSRRGYCEQFAGSFAAMARAIGLPARVAVGFTPGQVGAAGHYQVLDRHAHAWPEVYVAGFGWVAFEPTPGRGQPGNEPYTGVPAPAIAGADSATAPSPQTPPTTAGASTPRTTERLTPDNPGGQANAASHRPWWRRWWWLVVAGSAGLLGAGAGAVPLSRRWRRDRRRVTATTPEARVLVAWEEVEEALGLAGLPRRADETSTEYARRVPRTGAVSPTLLAELAGDTTAAAFSASGVEEAVATRAEQSATTIRGELALRATRAERVRWTMGIPTRREPD
jgi:transglutaminase-like putative cysteine protease